MDGPQEYEVESVTRARVHDKRGKKITWKYYVKWKGYDWDESTWEPTDSFQGGSEHILESFWERVDTGGRDISDAFAFKKGEELLVSGPPGKKGLKRKANSAKTEVSPSKNAPSSGVVTISAPLPRKRRRVQTTTDDEPEQSRSRRRVSTEGSQKSGVAPRLPRRRRVSSPGPRKLAPKRLPSAGDSQLDADGETDPDVVEIEDELMQVSTEDVEENTGSRYPVTANESASGSKNITFEDLEHFYSGNPIDIDQPTDELVTIQKPEDWESVQPTRQAAPSHPDDVVSDSQPPSSPTLSSPDPLFDSPSRFPDKAPDTQGETVLPQHRARVANPLVKLIDTTTLETTSQQARISAKARLMLNHSTDVSSASGSDRNNARRAGKSGPSSSGLIKKNRSSLLTATKGALRSIKGRFASATVEREQPDENEQTPVVPDGTEEDKLLVTSWSNKDNVIDQEDQTKSNSQLGPPPSGDDLPKLVESQTDLEALPDYEEDATTYPQEVEIPKSDPVLSLAMEVLSKQSQAEVKVGFKTSDDAADAKLPVSEAECRAPTPVVGDSSTSFMVTRPVNEAVKKNIELAKEYLFPSTQPSFSSFNTTQPSFRTTIFGPLCQGHTREPTTDAKNELSTTFKVVLGDGVELPLVLQDSSELKARISDILIGSYSGSKVALFYSSVDALAMVSTFKSDGTARVVLDPSAETGQQERFSALLQRFESYHTLIAPVGKEVCVLYSSENVDIAEKLGAPKHLRGPSRSLLITHASIENQLAYVAAIMKASAL